MPGVTVMRVMMCHRADNAGGELHFVNIAKRFLQKQNPLPIVRPVSPLAKPGHSLDVRRQMVGGAFAFFRRGLAFRTEPRANERHGTEQRE